MAITRMPGTCRRRLFLAGLMTISTSRPSVLRKRKRRSEENPSSRPRSSAWATDEIAGEANFDIERENIQRGQGLLPIDEVRPNKIRNFEADMEIELRAGNMKSELDVIRFCVEAGMTNKHAEPILKKLKAEGIIEVDFRVPDPTRTKQPRPIQMSERAP